MSPIWVVSTIGPLLPPIHYIYDWIQNPYNLQPLQPNQSCRQYQTQLPLLTTLIIICRYPSKKALLSWLRPDLRQAEGAAGQTQLSREQKPRCNDQFVAYTLFSEMTQSQSTLPPSSGQSVNPTSSSSSFFFFKMLHWPRYLQTTRNQ